MEYGDGIVFLVHVLEHSVRGHGRRLPEPHHPLRQHAKLPRRGAAAPPRPNYAPHAAARRVSYRRLKNRQYTP